MPHSSTQAINMFKLQKTFAENNKECITREFVRHNANTMKQDMINSTFSPMNCDTIEMVIRQSLRLLKEEHVDENIQFALNAT